MQGLKRKRITLEPREYCPTQPSTHILHLERKITYDIKKMTIQNSLQCEAYLNLNNVVILV